MLSVATARTEQHGSGTNPMSVSPEVTCGTISKIKVFLFFFNYSNETYFIRIKKCSGAISLPFLQNEPLLRRQSVPIHTNTDKGANTFI